MERHSFKVASRLLLVLGILSALSTFWGCSKKGIEEERYRVGVISPFSGKGANYGKAARNGIELAFAEINEQGGIDGKKIIAIYEDDKGNPTEAVSSLNKLANIDGVSAILGPFYSSNVLACAPVANRSKIVLLTGTATSDNVREAGEYVFRVCPSNDEQARTIAEYAYNNLHMRTSFILYRNVDYGITLRDKFKEAFENLGGTIVGVESVEPDTSDIRTQLSKVKVESPDFIYAAVHYSEGGALLRQAREMGVKSVVIGTDGGYDPKLLEIAGNAAEGSFWVTIGWADDKDDSIIQKFKKSYRTKYKEYPGVYSGLYYDAAYVMASAFGSANKTDGESIKNALKTVEYKGVTGLNKFDEKGDVSKPYAVYKVIDGAFELVEQ